MKQALDNYIKYLKQNGSASTNTADGYYRDISRFIDFLNKEGITDPEMVKKDDIYRYIELLRSGDITAKKISNATFSRNMSSLKSFYRYLNMIEGVKNNPLTSFKNAKIKRKLPDTLTYSQIEKLLDSFDVNTEKGFRDHLMTELLYATGIRVSELVGLKTDDFYFDEKIIRVIGKGNKERIVPFYQGIADQCLIYLTCYRNRYPSTAAFFVSLKGKALTSRYVQSMLKDAGIKAGLMVNVHPHALRHSFATSLLDNGADLRVVQELLGHDNLSTTQLYTHLTPDRLKDVINKAHPLNKRSNHQ